MPDVLCPGLIRNLGGWGDYIYLAPVKEQRILPAEPQSPLWGSEPGSHTSDGQRGSGGFPAKEASLCTDIETQVSGLALSRCISRIHWDLVTRRGAGASVLRGRVWFLRGHQLWGEFSSLTLSIPTNRALPELWVPGNNPDSHALIP